MIVSNFNIEHLSISPNETNAILIVNTDAVLALAITFQGFKTIAWKDCKIAQFMSRV